MGKTSDDSSHDDRLTDKRRPSGPSPKRPPDSIPNLMPGVDPEQTPGSDRIPAESDPDSDRS